MKWRYINTDVLVTYFCIRYRERNPPFGVLPLIDELTSEGMWLNLLPSPALAGISLGCVQCHGDDFELLKCSC